MTDRVMGSLALRMRNAVRGVVGLVPTMIFGNHAGLWNNLGAQFELRRLRKHCREELISSGEISDEGRTSANFMRKEGYSQLAPRYDDALLERILAQYNDRIEAPENSVSPDPAKVTTRRLLNPAHQIPEFKELINEEVKAVLQDYYRTFFKIDLVVSWRNYHVPETSIFSEFFSNTWHSDQYPVTGLALFVYLNEGVTRETGAFQFNPIGATKEIMRGGGFVDRGHIYGNARRRLEDPGRILYFEGGIGSACLCNVQLCLHRAGVPKEGTHRDIVAFSISPAARPLAENWIELLPEERSGSYRR